MNHKALAVVPPTVDRAPTISSYAMGMKGYIAFAQMLMESQMVPKNFKKPQDLVAAMLYGQEIGFSPMQSLQVVYIVNGKPALEGAGMMARILEAGGRVETIRSTDTECTLRGVRGDWKEEITFNEADAKKARLWGKEGPWTNYPKDMLRWKVIARIAKIQFADIIRGFGVKEDLEDEKEEGPKVQILPPESKNLGRVGQFLYRFNDIEDKKEKIRVRDLLKKAQGEQDPSGFIRTRWEVPELSEYLVKENEESNKPDIAVSDWVYELNALEDAARKDAIDTIIKAGGYVDDNGYGRSSKVIAVLSGYLVSYPGEDA